MSFETSEESEVVIDLKNDKNMIICEPVGSEGSNMNIRPRVAALRRNWSGFDQNMISEAAQGLHRSSSGSSFDYREYGVDLADKRMVGDENGMRKKVAEKHSKPPRPPKSLSVTAADQVLIREISELSMLKRARAKRMKEAKQIKRKKKDSSSNTNLCAMMVTIIFCLIIIWHAF